MNEQRKRNEQAKVDAERVADAIDLIHSVRFEPGREPKTPEEFATPDEEAAFAAHHLASSIVSAGGRPPELRAFQKSGISSRVVARCLRDGVLVAVAKEET